MVFIPLNKFLSVVICFQYVKDRLILNHHTSLRSNRIIVIPQGLEPFLFLSHTAFQLYSPASVST